MSSSKDTEAEEKPRAIKTLLRQLLGALGAVALWFADVKHFITDASFPLMTYSIPIGVALGWDFNKLLGSMLKGTKFEGILKDKEPSLEVPADLIMAGFEQGIAKEQIERAIKQGLKPDDIKTMMTKDPKTFRLMYDKD